MWRLEIVPENPLRMYLYLGSDGVGQIMGLMLLGFWPAMSSGSRVFGRLGVVGLGSLVGLEQ